MMTNRVRLPYSFIIKVKKNNILLLDDGKYAFKIIKKMPIQLQLSV